MKSAKPLLCMRSCSRGHIIFGANTDVGKTIVSAGLVLSTLQQNWEIDERSNDDGSTSGPTSMPSQSSSKRPSSLVPRYVNYVKPLQCGGSDQAFVSKVVGVTPTEESLYRSKTLFSWDSFTSPHYAARAELKPIADDQIIEKLREVLASFEGEEEGGGSSHVTFIESAGGVLSPASASPENNRPHHARCVASDGGAAVIDSQTRRDSEDKEDVSSWGWSTQADLYRDLHLPVVLVGDGRLGGISSTLTALESLAFRGYVVDALVTIQADAGANENNACINTEAYKEYLSRQRHQQTFPNRPSLVFPHPQNGVFSLPSLPPNPLPLNDWYRSTATVFDDITRQLDDRQRSRSSIKQ